MPVILKPRGTQAPFPALLNPLFNSYLPQAVFDLGASDYNLVTGVRLAWTGAGTISRFLSVDGIGKQFGDGTGTTYATFPVGKETVNSFTIVWIGQSNDASTYFQIKDYEGAGVGTGFWSTGSQLTVRVGGSTASAGGGFPTNATRAIVIRSAPSGVAAYLNGSLALAPTTLGSTALVTPWSLHRSGSQALGALSTTLMVAVFARPFSDALACAVSINPWMLFARRIHPILGMDLGFAPASIASAEAFGTLALGPPPPPSGLLMIT